jgi:UDP-4-amino-4,6-dideoxy-N-acetyl-beta-L-altrosamine transaminase
MTPPEKIYYYGRHYVEPDDVAAVTASISGDYLSQGPELNAFEEEVAAYCGARYALVVNSGTAALHLACLALGLKPGTSGWTSPLTFVADANAIRYCGAEVDFVDIDPLTFNISITLLEQQLIEAKRKGIIPKVVIPIHFAGRSCEMERIWELAKNFGFRVIEDGCHALGGRYQGAQVGCCQYSNITVFSLHPVKSITSGEGGLILTNDGELNETMRMMRSHGLSRGGKDSWGLEMVTEGFNYRITEMQCALGRSQLAKLDRFVAHRHELVQRYRENLEHLPVTLQELSEPGDASAWHIMVARLDFEQFGFNRAKLFEAMKARGVNLMVHYLPVHMHRFYKQLGFNEGDFPEAENYYYEAISLPLHPHLKCADIDVICHRLEESLGTVV